MSYSPIVTQRVVLGTIEIGGAATIPGGSVSSISEAIPDASTDLAVGFTLDVSATLLFVAKSDQAITIETNNGTTPDDTLTLAADVPYIWRVGSASTFELGTDVTSLFVTNASGSVATLEIFALVDPTPA